MPQFIVLAFVNLLLCCSPSAFANDLVLQPPAATSLPEQIELTRLVDLCAQRLKLNIEYDSSALKGAPITLRLGAGAADDELWALTNRLLASRGFTTVRMAGEAQTVSVVKAAEAAGFAGLEEQLAEAPGAAPGYRSIIVRAKYRPAKELAEALKPMISKQGAGQVGSVNIVELAAAGAPAATAPSTAASTGGQPGGLLILSDLEGRLNQTLKMLELLDTPSERVVVEERPVRNLSSSQLATLLTQVSGKQGTLSGKKLLGEAIASPAGASVLLVAPESQLPAWRELISQLDTRQPAEVATYTPKYFSIKDVAKLVEQAVRDGGAGTGAGASDDRFKVIADELTGSLIVTATPSQHERIKALIDRLDAAQPASRRPVRSFVIRNRPVKDVVAVLNDLLNAGVLDGADPADPRAGEGRAAPAGSSGGGNRELDAGTLVGSATASVPPAASRSTPNGYRQQLPPSGGDLVGTGTSGGAPKAGNRSVTLTADEHTNTMIAMGDPRALMQIEGLLSSLDVRQAQVMLELLLLSLTEDESLALGVELERLTSSGDAGIKLSSLFGLKGSFNDPNSAGSSRGGSVSVITPMEFTVIIRALENLSNGRALSMPKLLVANNQQGQFKSVSQSPVRTSVTTSSSATSAFGGYEPAGTTITVKPQIAQGDHLSLKYSVSLSSFTGPGSGDLPPPRQENSLDSEVTIPDAYTIAVGGIELNNEGQTTTQVPILGDIPIIGEAFKSRSSNKNRARFFVFIRAEVMRSTQFDDLKHVSGLTAEAVGLDDGFPSIEPQVIR